MEERSPCVAGAPLVSGEAAVWHDTCQIGLVEGLYPEQTWTSTVPGLGGGHQFWAWGRWTVGGHQSGQMPGLLGAQGLSSLLTNHRFWGFSEDEHKPLISTKLWVHPSSVTGTSTLGASLSSSQGVGGPLSVRDREKPQSPQTVPEGRAVEVTPSSLGPTDRSLRVNKLWATTCQMEPSGPETSYLLLNYKSLQGNQVSVSSRMG